MMLSLYLRLSFCTESLWKHPAMDEEQLILFVLHWTPHLKTPNYSKLQLYEKICEEVGQLILQLTTICITISSSSSPPPPLYELLKLFNNQQPAINWNQSIRTWKIQQSVLRSCLSPSSSSSLLPSHSWWSHNFSMQKMPHVGRFLNLQLIIKSPLHPIAALPPCLTGLRYNDIMSVWAGYHYCTLQKHYVTVTFFFLN